ncbi:MULTISPECIES: ribulokinase [unclassified Streptomyces]|uniref:ribulokinase n=1 Tax=unclassified Streptomyces TaxID=2593676 RepID=UPI00278BDAE1|nr:MULTISPECIES: ribulokinase [unclassified Streptomyces]
MSHSPVPEYVIGIDYGSLSGRAVVVRVSDGAQLGSAVHAYANAVITEELPGGGPALGVDWALQDTRDWVEVLTRAVPKALAAAGVDASQVVGIGTDFTACTVLPALADGTPLREVAPDRPHAWPKLWKHHAAQGQADRINSLAAERGETWLARYGGKISSEWEYAKALQVLEEDPETYERAERWIEAADWIIWQLTGVETRNTCTAGYKGIFQDGGYPSEDFLAALNPGFAGFTSKLTDGIGTRSGPDGGAEPDLAPLGGLAGRLSAAAARLTGLPEGIAVAVGNVDAHVTSAAADAVEPGQMTAIMGTSTCHVMPSDKLAEVPGMCGVVRDGIVPGLYGYEAGQSGVGDIFGWFTDHQVPPAYHAEAERRCVSLHTYLSELAAAQEVGEHGLVALDWHSGNRSVLVDHRLTGVIAGLTLYTKPEDVYRALVEATAFGARTIVEAFNDSGVPVTEFIAAGGLVQNPLVMQVYADVLNMPLSTVGSDQGPALGSAIHAAVAAGRYADIREAAHAMGARTRDAWLPDPERAAAYDRLYAQYRHLHDHLADGTVLHALHDIKSDAAHRKSNRQGVPAA